MLLRGFSESIEDVVYSEGGVGGCGKVLSQYGVSSGASAAAMREAFVPVVLDCGSGRLKAGFSCDLRPRCVLPSIVGRPKYQASAIDLKLSLTY